MDRFGQSETRDVLLPVATALVAKRSALVAMNRLQDALHACEEMVGRFGESEDPAVLQSVAMAFADKGFMLLAMDRLQDALDACEEMVGRFGESEDPAVLSVGDDGARHQGVCARRSESVPGRAPRL